MSTGGTAAHREEPDLPALVQKAVTASADFDYACHPDQGRLLNLLARGMHTGRIGETGTGTGVGLAWLAAADTTTTMISIERDPTRHAIARNLFAHDDRVTVLNGDWHDLAEHGPFDLLVLDGGGQGKGTEPPLNPAHWLRKGGTLVIDDFTPTTWPPEHDPARLHWLTHPDLMATEIQLNPTLATIVARYAPRK